MTRGKALSLVAYRMGILHLIKKLKSQIANITQPWYAYNAGALGTFARVRSYLNLLKQYEPGQGYSPKRSKIILIMHMYNIKAKKLSVLCNWFKVCMGTCYNGRYIGNDESKCDWLKKRRDT